MISHLPGGMGWARWLPKVPASGKAVTYQKHPSHSEDWEPDSGQVDFPFGKRAPIILSFSLTQSLELIFIDIHFHCLFNYHLQTMLQKVSLENNLFSAQHCNVTRPPSGQDPAVGRQAHTTPKDHAHPVLLLVCYWVYTHAMHFSCFLSAIFFIVVKYTKREMYHFHHVKYTVQWH